MCTLLHTKEVQNPKAQGTLSVRATFWACLHLIFSVTSTLGQLIEQAIERGGWMSIIEMNIVKKLFRLQILSNLHWHG